jgi:hypothetical protein
MTTSAIIGAIMFFGTIYFSITIGVMCDLSEKHTWINGFNFLNPAQLHQHIKVNWFGTALIAVVLNVLFAPYAIVYWIYKLCTIGRR